MNSVTRLGFLYLATSHNEHWHITKKIAKAGGSKSLQTTKIILQKLPKTLQKLSDDQRKHFTKKAAQ